MSAFKSVVKGLEEALEYSDTCTTYEGKQEMTKWIRVPYPGEKPGEGEWVECNTPWLKRVYTWTKLPKCQQKEKPNE